MSEQEGYTGRRRGRGQGENGGEDTISLLDIVAVLARRKWLIIGATLTAAVLVVAFSIYTLRAPADSPWNPLPNVYRSTVKILLQKDTGGVRLPSLEGGGTLSLLLGGAVSTDSNLLLAKELLAGTAIADAVAAELDFHGKYGLAESEAPKTVAREIFRSALDVAAGAEAGSNVLSVAYEDIDPEFAYRVVTLVNALLEDNFRSLGLERTLRKKRFIEERLEAVRQDLQKAQMALSDFQRQYGVLDISAQAQQQSALIAGLRSEILRSQMEIESLREYLPDTDPRIVRLRQEIEGKRDFVDKLRTGAQPLADSYIPQEQMSSVMYTYLNLQGELEVQRAVYRTLLQEYESVKIDEADNSKVFQVIEPPEVPEIKAGPSRGRICVIVTIAAFFLSVFLAFIREYLDRARRDPREADKLEEIRSALSLRRKG